MTQDKLLELQNGFETAYIDEANASNLSYKPQFISNNYKQGKKVLSSIEDELQDTARGSSFTRNISFEMKKILICKRNAIKMLLE